MKLKSTRHNPFASALKSVAETQQHDRDYLEFICGRNDGRPRVVQRIPGTFSGGYVEVALNLSGKIVYQRVDSNRIQSVKQKDAARLFPIIAKR